MGSLLMIVAGLMLVALANDLVLFFVGAGADLDSDLRAAVSRPRRQACWSRAPSTSS